MQSVVMLNVIFHNVANDPFMLSVVMLNVTMLIVTVLSFTMLSVIMLNVFIQFRSSISIISSS
jgi:hypothetical protein